MGRDGLSTRALRGIASDKDDKAVKGLDDTQQSFYFKAVKWKPCSVVFIFILK